MPACRPPFSHATIGAMRVTLMYIYTHKKDIGKRASVMCLSHSAACVLQLTVTELLSSER